MIVLPVATAVTVKPPRKTPLSGTAVATPGRLEATPLQMVATPVETNFVEPGVMKITFSSGATTPDGGGSAAGRVGAAHSERNAVMRIVHSFMGGLLGLIGWLIGWICSRAADRGTDERRGRNTDPEENARPRRPLVRRPRISWNPALRLDVG